MDTISSVNAFSAVTARDAAKAYWEKHRNDIKAAADNLMPAIYEAIINACNEGYFSCEYPLPQLDTYKENSDQNTFLGTIVGNLGENGYVLNYHDKALTINWQNPR